MSSIEQAIASWPAPNYVDPPTRGDGLVTASAVLGSLATVTTALRVYTRVAITRTFGIDDMLIVVAWMWCVAMMACLSVGSRSYGFNLHVWDIPFDKFHTANVYSLLFQITFSLSSSFTKLSLLWFCRRIMGDGRRICGGFYDISSVVVMAVIVLFEVIFLLLLFLQCRPLKALFDFLPTYPYVCNINGLLLTFIGSIANTITDFLTTLIPITLIAKLHLPPRQRIAIMTIFAFGVTINIAGSLRTYYEYRSMILTNLDHTWVGWPTCVCAVVEIGLGVIVTSAPALRPLMGRFLPSLLESRKKYRYAENGASSRYLHNSRGYTPRPSNSVFDISFLDRIRGKEASISNVTTSNIEMRPRSFVQVENTITIEKTTVQEPVRIAQWPESYGKQFNDGGHKSVGGHERLHFSFKNEGRGITRLYDEESNDDSL